MKRKHLLYYLQILGLMSFICLSACHKIDVEPMLEIEVHNNLGLPVAGAMVGLFNSAEEWSMKENPVQVWRQTSSNGKVVFANLLESRYYFFVEKDSLNNIGSAISTDKALIKNQIGKVLTIIN